MEIMFNYDGSGSGSNGPCYDGPGYGYGYGSDGYGYGYDGHGYGYDGSDSDGSNGPGYGYRSNGYGCGSDGYDSDGSGYDGLIFIGHKTPLTAYWYSSEKEHLGNKILVEKGATLNWPYKIELCKHGLHASFQQEDAKKYNPNGILCKVACSGWVGFQKDKLVCSRRKILEVLTP